MALDDPAIWSVNGEGFARGDLRVASLKEQVVLRADCGEQFECLVLLFIAEAQLTVGACYRWVDWAVLALFLGERPIRCNRLHTC